MVDVVAASSPFEVFVDADGVCVARGELDELTGTDLAAALAAHPHVTMVDLGEVSFVDSAGLRSLLVARAEREASGSRLSVRRSSGAVRRVMRLAGITHLFACEPDAAAAG
jgi:anti-sigma B factor antagonist